MSQTYFDVIFLSDAAAFLDQISNKAAAKVLYNIKKAQLTRDSSCFKKVDSEVREFRTRFNQQQFRLFAFWHSDAEGIQLVIATHGIIKKSSKIPKKEIKKCKDLRRLYLENH